MVSTRVLVARLIFHNPEYWGENSSYGKALTDTRFGRMVTQATKVTSQRPGGRGPRGPNRNGPPRPNPPLASLAGSMDRMPATRDLDRLRRGLQLSDGPTAPAEVPGAGHLLPVTHAAQVAGLLDVNLSRD